MAEEKTEKSYEDFSHLLIELGKYQEKSGHLLNELIKYKPGYNNYLAPHQNLWVNNTN